MKKLLLIVTFPSHTGHGQGKKNVDRSNWPFVALWSLVLAGYHQVNATLGSKAKIITNTQWRKLIFEIADSDTF